MAYEKQEWKCGDVVTAEKLNHMEDGIAEASGGGTADIGYECTYERTTNFNDSVTTEGDVPSAELGEFHLENDVAYITFNGVEYTCEPNTISAEGSSIIFWGATIDDTTHMPDWTVAPFMIVLDGSLVSLNTQASGTYTVKIEQMAVAGTTTTSCFKDAVKSVVDAYIGQPLYIGDIDSLPNSIDLQIPVNLDIGRADLIDYINSVTNPVLRVHTQNSAPHSVANDFEFHKVWSNNGVYGFVSFDYSRTSAVASIITLSIDSNGAYVGKGELNTQ